MQDDNEAINTVQVDDKLREVHQAATTVQRENTSPDVDVVVTTFGGGDEEPRAAATTTADFLTDDEVIDLDNVIINVTQVTVVSR